MLISFNSGESPLKRFFDHHTKRLGIGQVVVLTGAPGQKVGGGKSVTALKLGELLDDSFSIDKVTFSPRDFLTQLDKVEATKTPSQVVVLDEAAVSAPSTDWFSLSNKMLHFCFTTSRYLRAVSILVTPSFNFIDSRLRSLVNAWGYPTRYASQGDKDEVKLKLYTVRTDLEGEKRFFRKITMYNATDKRMVKFNSFMVSMPSQKLFDAYEAKSLAFKNDLRKSLIEQIDTYEAKQQGKGVKELNAKVLAGLMPKALANPDVAGLLNDKGKVAAEDLMVLMPSYEFSHRKAGLLAKMLNHRQKGGVSE